MTPGRALAQFLAELRWDALAQEIREKVEDHVLDTLGVICAGVDTPEGMACESVVRRWGSGGQCTVVGRPWRLPAPGAAFLNAFHARIHTFDDTHDTGPLHPGCAAVSAALACAESAGTSGKRFLTAVLAGYEAGARVSAAVSPSHYDRGFQNTGTCNCFAAAAAAGHVMGFDGNALLECLGLAGGSAAGLRQFQVDGSMIDTSFSGARAALIGVMSAQLRAAGLPGARGVLDGRWGFCRVMSDETDPSRLASDLGERFEFSATALKPYPSCRFTHGPVEELLKLRHEHRFTADDVEEVVIATFRRSIEVSDRPSVNSKTEAILSHQHAAAIALSFGRVDLSAFTDEAVLDPCQSALMRRIKVVHDEDLESRYPEHWPHRMTVKLRDGRILTGHSSDPPGGSGRPLGRASVRAKFLANAAPVLGPSAAGQLVAAVEDLPEQPNLDRLVQLLIEDVKEQGRSKPRPAPMRRQAS